MSRGCWEPEGSRRGLWVIRPFTFHHWPLTSEVTVWPTYYRKTSLKTGSLLRKFNMPINYKHLSTLWIYFIYQCCLFYFIFLLSWHIQFMLSSLQSTNLVSFHSFNHLFKLSNLSHICFTDKKQPTKCTDDVNTKSVIHLTWDLHTVFIRPDIYNDYHMYDCETDCDNKNNISAVFYCRILKWDNILTEDYWMTVKHINF